MTTSRRELIVVGGAIATKLLLSDAKAEESVKQADFLFVQTAKAAKFDSTTNVLTLEGVSPITIMFSDRPERIAANMKTAAFVPFWSKGKDSFLSDPPNADISTLVDEKLHQVVAVIKDPVLSGDNLSYTIKILEGQLPLSSVDVSVFIDVIGMPLTPMSFAGAARRGYRRGFY